MYDQNASKVGALDAPVVAMRGIPTNRFAPSDCDELDERMLVHFYDADIILREAGTRNYYVYPAGMKDATIAAQLGAAIVSLPTAAVSIKRWRKPEAL